MFAAYLESYGRDTKTRDHFGKAEPVVVLAFFVSAVEKMLVLNQIPYLYMRKASLSTSFSDIIVIQIGGRGTL